MTQHRIDLPYPGHPPVPIFPRTATGKFQWRLSLQQPRWPVGPEALYLVPIKDGRQAADPVFVRYGSFRSGQTTGDGSLVYQSTPAGGGYTAWIGTLDTNSADWKRLNLSGSNRVAFEPRWSPDSGQIVYL
jgi:hypothetical protein